MITESKKLNVLVACEFSGIVREAFRKRGHNAWSCDILPADDGSPYHYQCDIIDVFNMDLTWDLMIAHPPCTYFANSGVSWLHKYPERWNDLDDAADFFNIFLKSPITKICIENPIPHKYAIERIGGRKYNQLVQPYMFGHKETKATCFWLKGLEPLKPTTDLETMKLPLKERCRVYYMSEPNRAKKRSVTYKGIAEAMAEQWG